MPNLEVHQDDQTNQFIELYQAEWEWRMSSLGGQSYATVKTIDSFLPDVSEEAQEERTVYWTEVARSLSQMDPTLFSPAARRDYEVYVQQIDTLLNQQKFRMFERPANADTAFWTLFLDRGKLELRSEQDARNYLAQLSETPRYFTQQIQNMKSGILRGFGPAAVSMVGRDAPVETVVNAESVEDIALFNPLLSLPSSLPQELVNELKDSARHILKTSVVPAFTELLHYLQNEYFPNLPTEIAACAGAGGAEFYAAQLKEFTTTTLSPTEIHNIGLEEVAKIRAEMEVIAGEEGFDDIDGLLYFMRTDPQFYVSQPVDLLKEAAWHSKKFDAVVHTYFGYTPRHRFGIEEPPAALAPFYTFGRGGLGRYTLNTYDLPGRPLYSIPALTLHEGAPGHAFQVPFALEQVHHPNFRRHVYISAYGEGWGLYSERLGVEMGMYEGPFEYVGMLNYQMWRASRLVIDTGIHAFGWTRDEALDFLSSNTLLSQHEVATEVDRYIAWPGQAASYFIGQIRIQEARKRAEDQLGERFSIRNFHDAILELGSVPLDVLDLRVEQFIADGGASPYGEQF